MKSIGKSIGSKLWLGIALLISIILLIIWLFQIYFLNYFYVHERIDILLEEGTKIASLIIQTNNHKEVPPDVISEITAFTSSTNARISILDPNGVLIFSNFPERKEFDFEKGKKDVINDLELKSKIEKAEIFILEKHRFQHRGSSIIVGIPIKDNGKVLANVLLVSPLAPIKETTSILKKQLSIISFISLIIGTLLALLLAKLFTNPILKITAAAKKIAKGDFTARVQLNSEDEIGALGNIINDLPVQLEKIENFRKDFIANTSHELKTPISLIRAYAELIIDIEGVDKETRDKNLQVIVDEANRLNHIVEDILYLSQMESGYDKLQRKLFPVLETLNNVINKLYFFATEKNVQILLNIEDENVMVYADEEKIHQVFFNLLNNAISHSYENGEILINLNKDLRIEIIDQGEGIPEEDLPYIWDRFYKVDKSRKRNNNSTGLGLAIVKNILEAHHFKYDIESSPDKGTLVWIEMKQKE